MARFDSYTLQCAQPFKAEIELAYFRPEPIDGKVMCWEISGSSFGSSSGESIIRGTGNYFDIADIEVTCPEISSPEKLMFKLWIKDTDIRNSYELMVYPRLEKIDLEGTYIFENVNSEAENLLKDGKTVLILSDLSKLGNSIEGFYCQDFWCYHMFRQISEMMKKPEPVGTMGLLINNRHRALENFPSEKWSTPQWFDIVMNSRSEIMDDNYDGKNIIVQTIDNFERNHRLGLLYEYEHLGGKVVVCNCDFEKLSHSPEGRQFIFSIINYVKQ